MKIAILADPLDNQSAGVHTYTKGLVHALIQQDQQHEYILIREKIDPALSSKVRQIAIPNNRFLMLFAALRMFVIIPILLRRLRVDLVIEPAHFGPFNLPRRIRRVNIIHDLTPLLFPLYHPLHSRLLQRFFLGRILKKASLIAAVSNHTAKDIVRFFPHIVDKIITVYPGRDPFFKPDLDQTVLKKHQLNTPYFLTVGTIEPRKNLLLLLRAYQTFREQSTTSVSLVIAGGKGWKYQAFYTALDRHPFKTDIILTGYVEKQLLPSLYTHALAMIYPSLYEGFGLPVLEAMACGTKAICSNRSSLPEVGGAAALYFDPENKQQLVRHMHSIISDQAALHQSKSFSLQQAARFNWSSSARTLLQAIDKLIIKIQD